MHRKIFDLKTLALRRRQSNLIQLLRLNVQHLVADAADQVMMPRDFSVETGRRARVMKTPQHSQLTECFQNTVHSRPREPGNPPSHRFVDLVDGGMIITLEYGTQNITTLDRQRESLFAAQGLELLQPLLNVSRVHCHTRSLPPTPDAASTRPATGRCSARMVNYTN